ncbi:MAG: leucine-rich repeat protein [Candidatus Lokiarchaeota archaeon]|nr:leucine-rich repeat protein [Candidatus Lokiarchaeota archaeon]
MSEISISGYNGRGEPISHIVGTDATEIKVSGVDFVSVDLSELSKCKSLKSLNLWNNSLSRIDLSPLMNLPQLEEISLSINKLRNIDLNPLASISTLNTLRLGSNSLASLDLSPLSYLSNFSELYLSNNEITHVDLQPLKDCDELRNLYLSGNRLKSIDLTALSNCEKLIEFDISDNEIEEIELQPLSSLKSLRYFNLSKNPIQYLDISALSGCEALEVLLLFDMSLRIIDLRPLANCHNLDDLDLSYNQLQFVNLEPLQSCVNLTQLNIRENSLESIDLTPISVPASLGFLDLSYTNISELQLYPLSFCSSFYDLQAVGTKIDSIDVTPLVFTLINTFDYMDLGGITTLTLLNEDVVTEFNPEFAEDVDQFDVPVFSNHFEYIRKLIDFVILNDEDDWKLIHIMRDVLCSLDLESLGILDISQSDLMFFAYERDIDQVKSKIISLFLKQIERNGSSILVDVSSLSKVSPEISLLVPEIPKIRDQEVAKILIPIVNDTVDLKPLLCTAYGFQICSAIGVGTSCHKSELITIEEAFNQLDISIPIVTDSKGVYPSGQSKAFRDYISILFST